MNLFRDAHVVMRSFPDWINNIAKVCFPETLRYVCIISRGGTSDLPEKERRLFIELILLNDRGSCNHLMLNSCSEMQTRVKRYIKKHILF